MEIADINSFIQYFKNIRKRTMNVVRCIPPEKIEWKPKEGKMSFGDIIRHLALAERYIFVEIVKNNNNKYPGFDQVDVRGYHKLINFMEDIHQESMEILRTIPNAELTKKIITPGGQEMTMWKWLRAMVEHEVHHRGAMYNNLSLLDIKTPPIFGREESEVRKKN